MSIGSPDRVGFHEPSLPSVVINDPTKLPVCGEGVELRAEAVDLETHEAHTWRHVTADFSHYVKLRTTSRPVFQHRETGERFSPEPNHRFSRKYSHDRYGQILRGERKLIVRYDNLHTALITLTAPVRDSSGTHLPIDRHKALIDGYESVRQKLYYELKQKRGLEYEYVAVNGPTRNGQALGNDHIHLALYIGGEINHDTLRPVLDTHVETCDLATYEEHPPDRAVQVREVDASDLKPFGMDSELGSVTPLGRYVAGHLPAVGAQLDVRDKPNQFLRHGAISWASRTRTFRASDAFRESESDSDSSDWQHVGVQTADGEIHENTSGPTQPRTVMTSEPFED